MNAKAKELAKSLNQRQLDFANAFLKSGNAYQSAIDAGYTEATAKNAVVKLVENGGISLYMAAIRGDVVKSTIATLEEIAEFHTAVMRNDATKITVSGSTIVLGEGSDARAIESVKFDKETGNVTEVKCVSKTKAAEDLGKHLGYFDKDNEQRKPSIVIQVPDTTQLPDIKSEQVE